MMTVHSAQADNIAKVHHLFSVGDKEHLKVLANAVSIHRTHCVLKRCDAVLYFFMKDILLEGKKDLCNSLVFNKTVLLSSSLLRKVVSARCNLEAGLLVDIQNLGH